MTFQAHPAGGTYLNSLSPEHPSLRLEPGSARQQDMPACPDHPVPREPFFARERMEDPHHLARTQGTSRHGCNLAIGCYFPARYGADDCDGARRERRIGGLHGRRIA